MCLDLVEVSMRHNANSKKDLCLWCAIMIYNLCNLSNSCLIHFKDNKINGGLLGRWVNLENERGDLIIG